jgi:ABC transporter, phosphonate, periplasmic substrate-binding protein
VPPSSLRRAIAAGVLLLGLPAARAADDLVAIVVLKEHGVGNQALAQPYLDRMLTLAAKQNGWAGARGKYFTSRSAADAFIKSAQPHYGILSLPAFLAMREPYKLTVIGRVAVSLAGGRRYYLISKTARNLNACRGKTLATDHADDPRFIDTIVFDGDAQLADFTLVQTQRPLQTIKAVLTAQAVCALIDDAQKDQLDHLQEKDGLHTAWESDELPPMPVVAFPSAPAVERERFKRNLDKVCDDEGKSACAEVGIDDLTSADDAEYAAIVRSYGN